MMRAVRVAGSISDTVVVASGAGFADALAIGPWAYATQSPIVLSGADGRLTDAALVAIKADPKVKKIVVVGGPAAVRDVEAQLGADFEVVRLAGATRFETSAKVAEWAAEHGLG